MSVYFYFHPTLSLVVIQSEFCCVLFTLCPEDKHMISKMDTCSLTKELSEHRDPLMGLFSKLQESLMA